MDEVKDAQLMLALVSDNASGLVLIEPQSSDLQESADPSMPDFDPSSEDDSDSPFAYENAPDIVTFKSQSVRAPAMDFPQPADSALSPPEKPSTSSRFRKVTEEQLQSYQEMTQSKNTKKHTRWGVKILHDWHLETFNHNIDLSSVSTKELAAKLNQFYCEARPCKTPNEEYHKNTLKGIRAAINRRLSDLGRDIDIVNDKSFKTANKCLTGILKQRKKEGTSRPTNHKEVISKADLQKISAFLETAYSSPINLRLAVWYIIAVHFLSRGFEFHCQLERDSFEFKTDENGMTYACLTQESKRKNYQSRLDKNEVMADKRMYETQSTICPVRMLKFFLSKTVNSASNLFNKCVREALVNPTLEYWYTGKPLTQRAFVNFLPSICKMAGCQRYTAPCLRVTAIQIMNNAGAEGRQVMYMSGQRNVSSNKSYNKELSSNQENVANPMLSITEVENPASVNTETKGGDRVTNTRPLSSDVEIVPCALP
ncbi:uncharacterized protein LOC133199094 [Saccostrea echinata]|uniref:uncharacterized protein LOC133199094 n=1 Tax=Saccostrea echinata TaxID=191078 RepID=UPI002A7EB02B|nr:uncharacterized protein LOC133199094 [Saccostrea echinata]